MEFFWTGYTEILQILLSWPPIALLMLIIIIVKFKDQIASLLGRVTSGKILGNEFQTAPINQLDEASHIEKDSLSAKAKSADIVVSNTDSTNEEKNHSVNNNPAIDYILTHPTEALFEYQRVLRNLNFEILFNRIFGTQIDLLEFLASHSTSKFSSAQLYHFYQEHQRRAASNDYQMRDYFRFLVLFQAIKVSDVDNDHFFSITTHGLDFLSYIKFNYKGTWNLRNL